MEEEQNVVIQRTLGLKLPYRGTMEDLQALNKELLKSCIIPCSTNKQLIRSEVEKSNELLQNTCVEVEPGFDPLLTTGQSRKNGFVDFKAKKRY